MSDHSDLIKKLWAKVDEIDEGGPHYSKSAIYRDAAKALNALIEENDQLRQRNADLEDAVDKMQEGIRAIQLHQSKRRKTT
jgi:hypothetical protein